MTKLALVVAGSMTALLAARPAYAQHAPDAGGTFGLGLQVGTVDGLSGKWWISPRNAIQFGLAFDYAYYGAAPAAFADYLWHPSVLTSGSAVHLLWHIGVGGEGGFGEHYYYYQNRAYYSNELGVRVPIGLDALFNAEPFDIFGEVAPTLIVTPYGALDLWADLGGRFYF